MTMSRNLGFMKADGDVDGVLKQLQKIWTTGAFSVMFFQ